jgi:predicted MFS family arabinose efflux permease
VTPGAAPEPSAAAAAPEPLLSARLALAFVTMLLVSGIANTFPVFFPALLEEFGGTRAATAFTVSLLWIGGAALGPLAGALVARRDPRLVVIAGLGAMAAGLAVGTVAPTLAVFTTAVGLGGGIAVGLTGMVTQAALIADAYVRRRGFAIGIAFSGSMAGYLLAGPAHWAITQFGWRVALGGYVVATLALVPAAWRICPRRLRAVAAAGGTPAPPAGAIFRSVGFWSLVIVFTVPPLVGYLATIQHSLYLTARGFSAAEASALLVVGGVLSTSGRALAGLAADRLGGLAAGFGSYAMSLAGLLCLAGVEAWPSRLLVYGYVLLVFFPLGSRATIVSVLVGRIAPPVHYGLVFGVLSIGNNLGAAAGPVLSGAIYDRTGSYLVLYLVGAALIVLALAALAVFARTTRPAPAAP